MSEVNLNQLYPKAYGQWAGRPEGIAPDYTRCCKGVVSREGGWTHEYQCTRKRGYGPDGAYCKQHDPEAAKERRAEADKRATASQERYRIELAAPRFLAALRRIAAGHNDPRGLAESIVKDFPEKEGR